MFGKLLVAGTIAAAAVGLAAPSAAMAHDYHGGGYYGGGGYYNHGYRDWRPHHRWHKRHRYHNRWYSGRDYRWGRHNRHWRGHDRGGYYGGYNGSYGW